MRIPTRVIPRTQETEQPLAGLQVRNADANAFGAQIGQALGNLGDTAQNAFGEMERRKNQTEDLDLQRRLNEHQTDYFTQDLPEVFKRADPTGSNVRAEAEKTFDARMGAFMSTVPEGKKAEYALKVSNLRQSAATRSSAFEAQQQETYANTTIADATNQAKIAIGQFPDDLPARQAAVFELINKSALSEIAKDAKRREVESALAQVRYSAVVKTGEYDARNQDPLGGASVFVDRLFQRESGGDRFAANTRSTAKGPAQFLESTWLELLRSERPDLARGALDETLLAMRTDEKLSRELALVYARKNGEALRSAGFAPSPGNIYLAHFLGPEGAKRVLASSDATPIETVVGAKAFQANKEVFEKNPTVGALKQWASMDVGSVRPVERIVAQKDANDYWIAPGVEYDLAGKVRPLPPSKEYIEKVMPALKAVDPALGIRITSGGQRPGEGTGSHRHDVDSKGESGTTDFVLTKNGKALKPGENKELYARAMEELAAQGFTGIGHYEWGLHVGGGSRAVWGPDKSGASADPQFKLAVERGWSRATDGRRDALDTDSAYRSIPYETRLTLRADAERQAIAQINADSKEREAQRKQKIDGLKVGIVDGIYGRTEYDMFRQAGVFQGFEEINSVLSLLKKQEGDIDYAKRGYDKAKAGLPFDPTSDDDKKSLNAMVGEKGIAAIGQKDKAFFTDNVVPIVQAARDIPTEVVGTLRGMLRSANPDTMLYGYDALAQLERAEPQAYKERVPEDVRKEADRYELLRRNQVGKDDLVRMMGGNVTPEERQARKVRRKDGEDLLAKKDGKVPKIDTILAAVVDGYDNWYSSAPKTGRSAVAASALELQAQSIWLEEYALSGDDKIATEMTKKTLGRRWGVTELGGQKTLMEYPPEKTYRAIDGSHAWLDKSIRRDVPMEPGQKYEMVSDAQTQREVEAGIPPSYIVMPIDKYGTSRTYYKPDGSLARVYMEQSAEDKQAAIDAFDKKLQATEDEAFFRDYQMARRAARRGGEPIPTDIQEEAERRDKRIKATLAEEEKQARNTRQIPAILGVDRPTNPVVFPPPKKRDGPFIPDLAPRANPGFPDEGID